MIFGLISKEEIILYWLQSERNLHSCYFFNAASPPQKIINQSDSCSLKEIMKISDHVSGGMVSWKDINPTSQFVSLRTKAKRYKLVQILLLFASLSHCNSNVQAEQCKSVRQPHGRMTGTRHGITSLCFACSLYIKTMVHKFVDQNKKNKLGHRVTSC